MSGLPPTERANSRFADLDRWDSLTALETLWEGQMAAIAALRPALPAMAAAADAAAARLADGEGRLIYAGAGTSGRLAALDAAELPPTFGWPVGRSCILPAGGAASLLEAVEGAEDDAVGAEAALLALSPSASDVVIALAASGGTPWAVAIAKAGRARGALVISIANNAGTALLAVADHGLLLETGAEAIAGSTRMKAGTAQKAALTLLSTQIMIRLGRVYEGRMVEMRPTNAKLAARAARMVADLAGSETAAAETALAATGGAIKPAVLMLLKGLNAEQAQARLLAHGGQLRAALEDGAASG